jgi:hypothetical protein
MASCLDNQPYHLLNIDNDREAKGLQPLYLSQRYAQVGGMILWLNWTAPAGQRTPTLKYNVPSISSSIVTLEVAADSFTFVQNFSPGQVRCYAAP